LHGQSNQEYSQPSLEAAEALCRSCVPADGSVAPDELYDLRAIQIQALESWARENDSVVTKDALPALQERTNEHLVAFREADSRWVKVTKPGRFGYIADTDFSWDKTSQRWIGSIILREALPSEYLARLILQNEVFEDAVLLEGILITPDTGLSLVSSQPDISGDPSSLTEIFESMEQSEFEKIPGLHLGYVSSLSFYRRIDAVAVFDAHPANAVTSHGVVFPIDFIIQRVSSLMKEQIENMI
jgi:hypothetical protein